MKITRAKFNVGRQVFTRPSDGSILDVIGFGAEKDSARKRLPARCWPHDAAPNKRSAAGRVADDERGPSHAPADRLKRIIPDKELSTTLQQMDRDGVNQLPVITGSRVVGMLVITFLRTVHQLAS